MKYRHHDLKFDSIDELQPRQLESKYAKCIVSMP